VIVEVHTKHTIDEVDLPAMALAEWLMVTSVQKIEIQNGTIQVVLGRGMSDNAKIQWIGGNLGLTYFGGCCG